MPGRQRCVGGVCVAERPWSVLQRVAYVPRACHRRVGQRRSDARPAHVHGQRARATGSVRPGHRLQRDAVGHRRERVPAELHGLRLRFERHAPLLPDRPGLGGLRPVPVQAQRVRLLEPGRALDLHELDGEHHVQRNGRHVPRAGHLLQRVRRLQAGISKPRNRRHHRRDGLARYPRSGRRDWRSGGAHHRGAAEFVCRRAPGPDLHPRTMGRLPQ